MESSDSAGTRWNVAVDGSDASSIAFHVVFDELRKDGDYTIVSHVYSKSKDYLSMRYKPENMKQDYEAKLIGTHTSKWTMVWEPLEKDLTTKQQINKIAKDTTADILCLGYHGRKGPKEDPTLLGSAVEYIAHHPVCPVLIIKQDEKRSEKESGGFRWLVCSDGSEKSYKALRETIKLLNKDKDELIVLAIKVPTLNPDPIETEVNQIADDNGVTNFKFEIVEREYDEQTFQAIVDYINIDESPYIDFVTVANQGSGYSKHTDSHYLGKVAKGVLTNAKSNVILVF